MELVSLAAHLDLPELELNAEDVNLHAPNVLAQLHSVLTALIHLL